MLNPDQLSIIELDVSELEPPEPLLAIFAALIQLPDNHRLDISHRRQPFPLFGMLDQTGYQHRCLAADEGYLIQVWPGVDANPQALARLVAQPPRCQ